MEQLIHCTGEPNLKDLIFRFLREEMGIERVNPDDLHDTFGMFSSAVALIHAPSDPSGIGGMRREFIRATHSWRKGTSRFDCMLYKGDAVNPRGMHDLQVVRARLFFRFGYKNQLYSCALVHWFKTLGDEPDNNTGMWKTEPIFDADGKPLTTVVPVSDLVRAVHILPVFKVFYVNKFIDNHSFWLVS